MKGLLLLSLLVSSAVGYSILCLHPVPSKSHFHLVKGIVQPLLEAGHQVTFLTVYPEAMKANKNLKVLDFSVSKQFIEGIDMSDPKTTIADIKAFSRNISLSLVQSPALREVIVKEKFDAVVTEWFFSDLEGGYAAVLQVPWIVLSGNVLHTQVEQLVDAVRTVPIIPLIHTNHPTPINFWQRLQNTFIYIMMTVDEWKDHSLFKSDYEQNFGPLAAARGIPLPPFEEVNRNVSILLSNSHPSFAPARSIPPNLIEIGGYHIDANIPVLPKDLQDILDSSPQGVIYFSMGSVLRASALKESTRNYLIETFRNLKQTVLWKFDEELDNLPKNVHVRSWMPQSSILAHPNVKVFITHGGLLSTLESIQYGVPLLAIPVFGDQPSNAARSVHSGHALKVDFSPDMGPSVKMALEEILRNDSYHNKAKYISKLFRNRLNKPSELITHYIELAIESQGALHLRSAVRFYKWYEYWMLDQILLVLVIIYGIYFVLKKIISTLTRPRQENKQKRKKKE